MRKKNNKSTPDVFQLDVKMRVLNLVDDETHSYGMTLLTDETPNEDDFHN